MPELPEVETTRAGIEPVILNQKIYRVIIRNYAFRWPIDNNLASLITGQLVVSVNRRAKYLLIVLENGTLIIHLGMSGSIRMLDKNTKPEKHDHVDIQLSSGRCLRLNDPRRFGAVLYTTEPILQHPLLSHLGPEPLSPDFNSQYLQALCRKKTQPIKNILMNASIVVGVGNIYANEALFLAKIHPLTPGNAINDSQISQLITCIKQVLDKAIKQGGTTLKDFSSPDGKPGYFAQELSVYGRKGLPCVECQTELQEIRLQNRSSVYCPQCQKL